jgi:transcriptional adapter 2-alpha
MPGRLEFDTEVENEAEVVIKDMEFGLVMQYGGADQPEPPPAEEKPSSALGPTEKTDPPVKEDESVVKIEEEAAGKTKVDSMKVDQPPPTQESTPAKPAKEGESEDEQEPAKPPKLVFEVEDPDDVELKLTMLEIYYEKLDARTAAKDLIFDRGLMEFKKVRGRTGRVSS